MNIQDAWEKALKNTHITRPRVQPLQTFEATTMPYLFLAESLVNEGDTVVRKGEIVVEKPMIVLPSALPQFEGFKFEEELEMNEDFLMNFFLVRGVKLPSMKYNNKTNSLDIFEGRVEKAREFYGNQLQRKEDVATGLITGPEDVWQFSVLFFIATQISKSANGDIKNILDDFQRKADLS